MLHRLNKTLAAALVLLYTLMGSGLHAQQAQSTSPRTLSYQGVLSTNVLGNSVSGTRKLTVTLYGDPNGVTQLWQGVMNTSVDVSGVFNCILGTADNPLPDGATMDRPIWLGVAIDSSAELRPLSQLSSSPYSLNVADSSITTNKLADGAVTWNKMGTEYVPYIRVNGAKVTTGQNSINFTGGEGLMVDYDSTSMSVIVHPDTALTGLTKGNGMKTLNSVNGTGNSAVGVNDFEGGGLNNTIDAPNPSSGLENTLTGGETNLIGQTSDHNFIGGGKSNKINSADEPPDGDGKAISFNTIGGGTNNGIAINDDEAATTNTIGGGSGNDIATIDDDENSLDGSFIGGGVSNQINSSDGVIAGGYGNSLTDAPSTITYNFIGAGESNSTTNSLWGFIGGGYNSQIVGTTSFVVQGSTISGGYQNLIQGTLSNAGTIGGGNGNHIGTSSSSTTDDQYSVIAGGEANVVDGRANVISGGYENATNTTCDGRLMTIGGGGNNVATGFGSTIPGGIQLQTVTIAQTAVGLNNWTNTFCFGPNDFCPTSGTGFGSSTPNDLLFMVGNGCGTDSRHNAFEVSYNGHSTVFDRNGTGGPGGRAAIKGTRYEDNTIVAWADVPSTLPSPFPITLNSDFGVASVIQVSAGVYTVTLNLVDPLSTGGATTNLTGGSVIVTIESGGCLMTAESSAPSGSTFTINTNEIGLNASAEMLKCTATSCAFMFQVCGRPSQP